MSLHIVKVPLADRSYDVVVGNGAVASLARYLPQKAKRAVIITQQGIDNQVSNAVSTAGLQCETAYIGRGEEFKSLQTIQQLCESFAQWGITRNDLIIGVGGGMVTDVAGFAAASWHRGTDVIHVSTSLVGMVDAAIGGKTGVNLAAGKNLVGAFWQPKAVICDTSFLNTLPDKEIRCGHGEMAKYHFLTGDDLVSLELDDRVARCVQIKADIVASDEREGGLRALLNYGHTLGHAIEIETNFAFAHGEAVAIGLIFASKLAHSLGRVPQERVEYHMRIVGETYGLQTAIPKFCSLDRLMTLMAKDKKAVDGLTFVLDGPQGVETVAGIPPQIVHQTLEAMEVL
jgi:5-deoxy-5-amino-3-dehydroquinate synthase